jgi:ATP-dependent protease ClpP protease subunit
MAKFYTINSMGPVPEIWIYGDIGESWHEETTSAANFVSEINAIEAQEITVRINSVGGSVPDALAIYNAIKRHPAQVTAAIDGVAMSSASLIAMAGDSVQMAENAVLMIHAPWMVVAGNSSELREHADHLDLWASAMATTYSRQSGKSVDDVMAILTDGKDHYYTAAEALDEGFIDGIAESIAIAASARISPEALARFQPKTFIASPEKSPGPTATIKEINFNAIENSQSETDTMENKTDVSADAEKIEREQAAKKIAASALADDAARREDIRAQFKPFASREGMDDLQAKLENDTNISAAQAGQQILEVLGKEIKPVAGSIRVTDSDGAERFKADAVNAILVKAGLADAETRQANKGSPFNGFRLLDFAKASLDRNGISHTGSDTMGVVGVAFTSSTSDFPILLESVMHKVLQDAYATAADTWSRFCSIGSVSDFRAHNRYRNGSLGTLDTLNELGEFKNKTIPDGEKGSITAGTRGNIINVSRQMIIDDDLGAFLSLAAQLGRAGRRTIETAVYALLAENAGLGPTMSDGNTLFHATHGNIGTGAGLSVSSLDADRVLMGSQTDVSGNDFLDLTPDVLLVPLGLGGAARSINNQEYDDDSNKNQRKPNMVRGLFSDVVDTPRMTGTRRYVFASAQTAPVIEVAFLDGNQEPFIEQQAGFTVDGTQYKARLDFGVAAIDHRGATTNAGA